jgi:hypothetical protein
VLTRVLRAFIDVDFTTHAGVAGWTLTREASYAIFADACVFARVGCAVVVIEFAVRAFETSRTVAAVGGEPILTHAVVQARLGVAIVVVDLADRAFVTRVAYANELRVERRAAAVLTRLLRAGIDHDLTMLALVTRAATAAVTRALGVAAAAVIAGVLATRIDRGFAMLAFVTSVAATTEEVTAWVALAMLTGVAVARADEFLAAIAAETRRTGTSK